MKIYHDLPESPGEHPVVLAIGFFDGMHRGHRAIVRSLMRLRKPGFRAVVLTFRNHPSTVLRPGNEPRLITTTEERVNLIAASGVDELYLIPFDESIARLPAESFLEEMLVRRLGIKALAIGENFRFGAKRGGDPIVAERVLSAHGIPVVAIPAVDDEGERVSSTRIRTAIGAGELDVANRLLGAPYALRGEVVLGKGRGHDLGFPTANLRVPKEKLIPADGVYAVVGRYDGRDHPGLVSIGTNPTFEGQHRTIEAWLRDFSGSIYGEELALRDFRFIREQRRFDSVDALLVQMRHDATHVAFPSFI
jgi:riboflavin kinase/FMN adenylyltransferase